MRETSPRGWHRWRVTVVTSAPPPAAFARANRLSVGVAPGAGVAAPEVPAPDGIRHDLVARIRQQIAAGTYDLEEKWLVAEEALFRRIEGRA